MPLLRSAALLALLTTALPAEDWARFRGPNGTGVADPKTPTSFDVKKDLLWKAKLPGVGHGSPIVVGDKVFLQAAATDGSSRSLVCLSAKTGDQVWAKSVDAKSAKTHKFNNLAASTPCSDGERVYTTVWDGTGVTLYAFDLDGNEKWKKDLGSYASEHGFGHSPMVYGGLVYFNFDQDGVAELVAHDAKTGEQKWKAKREAHRASYTTPFVIEHDGKAAELIVGSTTTVDSYDPLKGGVNWEYKLPWGDNGKPLRSIGQPVFAGGNVIVYTGEGGSGRLMVAVKDDGKGDVGKDGLAWKLTKETPYVPGVLVKEDYLYWVTDDGMGGCADAKSGKVKWTDRVLSEKVSASPLLVGDTVFVIGETGTAGAFKADPKGLGEVTKSEVGQAVFATPAAVDGKLFVRGGTHLFCFGKK